MLTLNRLFFGIISKKTELADCNDTYAAFVNREGRPFCRSDGKGRISMGLISAVALRNVEHQLVRSQNSSKNFANLFEKIWALACRDFPIRLTRGAA